MGAPEKSAGISKAQDKKIILVGEDDSPPWMVESLRKRQLSFDANAKNFMKNTHTLF